MKGKLLLIFLIFVIINTTLVYSNKVLYDIELENQEYKEVNVVGDFFTYKLHIKNIDN